MHLTIFAPGSRGDTLPYLALALGFKQSGHRVRVVAAPEFESLTKGSGIEHQPLAIDPRALLASEAGKKGMSAGSNPFLFLRNLRHILEPVVEKIVDAMPEACHGSDALLMPGSLGELDGPHGFRPYGLPLYSGYLWPATPTAELPISFFPELPRGLPGRALYNRSTYVLLRYLVHLLIHPIVVKEVSRIPTGPPFRDAGSPPILYGFSPNVVPRAREWGDDVHVTGYWFLNTPADWRPQPELSDFLASGPPPVYVGFGGAAFVDPEADVAIAVEALRLAGQRGIVMAVRGPSECKPLPDFLLPIESAPHDWLFPKMVAVVHHGGAGTTAAGMRAGVPSVVVPFSADQPFWGRRVRELGVGPRPIPRKKLTARGLAEAIEVAVRDRTTRERAASLGERIRAEDGVSHAVDVVTRHFERFALRRGGPS
jgi:sterol 3beta-glucosyltransferase